jgi:putative redox protein
MANNEVLVSSSGKPFEQSVTAGRHRFTSDEPLGVGGGDAGPDPYDLLLAALGTCTSMTMTLYARRKKWPLERVDVRLVHARNHAADCADCEGGKLRIESIERRIALAGALTTEQRSRLLAIAEKCPVHVTLTGKLEIHTTLAEEPAQP